MVQKRGKKYAVRVYVGGGRTKWVGTFDKRSDAVAAERREQMKPGASRATKVADYAAEWFKTHPRPRAATNRHNTYMLRPFVSEFGSRRLDSIHRSEARSFSMKHKGSYPVVRAMFNDAIDDDVLTENPFSNLGISKGRGRKDITALTESEVYDLADTALELFDDFGPTFRASVIFAAFVGLRPAEMFVLRWSDIDFEAEEVHIRRSLGNTNEVTLPKNGKTRRVVLPMAAKEALLGLPRGEGEYVFTIPSGAHFTKPSFNYYWQQLRIGAGRPKTNLYELRHFCATELLRRGVTPADVAVQLGHTDGGALVMSTYGHPEEEAARDRVRAAFGAKPHLTVVGSASGE